MVGPRKPTRPTGPKPPRKPSRGPAKGPPKPENSQAVTPASQRPPRPRSGSGPRTADGPRPSIVKGQRPTDGARPRPVPRPVPRTGARPSRPLIQPRVERPARQAPILPGDLPDLGQLPSLLAQHVAAHYTPHRFEKATLPLERIHRDALLQLSGLFTSERPDLPAGYLTQPKYRGAYLLYFVPTGVATMMTVLRDSLAWPPSPDRKPLRVLDIASGPLTASLAVALLLPPDVPLEVTAIDASGPILDDGRTLMRQIRPDAVVHTLSGNLREGRLLRDLKGRFDLILMANFLNEWSVGGRKKQEPGEFVEKVMVDHLAEGGAAVLVEPATRTASHHLIAVREHIVENTGIALLGPCLGTMPCPLGAASMRDWCHAERPWERPPMVVALDEAIGHRRSTLKYSWLALGDRGQPVPPPNKYRAVGGPMRAAGAFRRYLCGPEGRVVALFEDDRVPATLRDAWRGQSVVVTGDLSIARRGPYEETVLRPQTPQRR